MGLLSSFHVCAQCQFGYSKTITIDNGQVSGSTDLVDFPVYISFTDNQFRSQANGGNIQNVNGYDIRLMLVETRSWLDFIIHSYDPSTGAFEIYVTVPALKATQDTKLEIFYSNASVSSDPSSDTTYNSTRTADWIATQDANRSDPSAFYSIGAQKQADCSGPGGVGQMDGTSNLVLWLKADAGVEDANNRTILNGNDLYIWRDQSGYGIDAVEMTNRPVYQTDQVEGRPAINFSATAGDRILASGVSTDNAYMIFIVAEANSFASNNIGLVHAAPVGQAFSAATNSKSIGMWVSTAGNFWGRLIQSNGTFVNYNQTSTLQTGAYFMMTNYADGTNTTGQYFSGLDASTSVSYNGTVQDWVEFGIGRQGTESWDGHIAEVIVFNTYLNESQRSQVENYLASKYRAEIPRLFGTTGPAGIGERDGSSQLELWLDAQDLDGDGLVEGSSEDGQSSGTISIWSDKSGNAVNLTTGSAAHNLINDGLNDMPSVDFNGTSHYLQSANAMLTNNDGQLEYFMVIDDAGIGSDNNRALLNWETTGNVGGISLETRNAAGTVRSRHYTGGGYANVNVNGFTNSDPYILNNRYGSTGRDFLRNGTSISSNATAIDVNNPANAPFAIGRNISGGQYAAVDVAEFISFSVLLNNAEREILEQYLSEKYAIAISGPDYYTGHSGAYTYGVQGIGTTDGQLINSHVESNASNGLIISMANGSFDAADEYVFTGHNNLTGGISTDDLSSVPNVEQRVSRVWYLHKTGTVDIDMSFNIQEAVGTEVFPAGDGYVLLYSASGPAYDFVDLTDLYGIDPVVTAETVSFTVPDVRLINGYYTLATTNAAGNPLPIELLSFTARLCDQQVCIDWVTASEIDNDYFQIEKSVDGVQWEIITRIEGAGDSDELQAYSYVDHSPSPGQSFYRLKQTDFDGTSTYSEISRIAVAFDIRFEVYPNPAREVVSVVGQNISEYTLQVYQLDGKIIKLEPAILDPNHIKIETRSLSAGIYFISMSYQGTTYTRRVVVMD